MQALLQAKAIEINIKYKNAEEEEGTSLHRAAEEGHTAVVQALLDKGADVNSQNEMNRTPLHLAAIEGRTAIVPLLQGTDPTSRDDQAKTPLHWAAENGHTETFNALLVLLEHTVIALKDIINSQDEDGRTPLHWAAENNKLAMVQALLDRGADVSISDADGELPADLATDPVIIQKLEAAKETGNN